MAWRRVEYFLYMMYNMLMNIPLSSGGFAKIDDEDSDIVLRYKWTNNKGYAQAVVEGTTIRMHRLVLGLEKGRGIVDHINGDRADNRKSNLRVCTPSQNRANTTKTMCNRTGYKGVVFRKANRLRPYAAFAYIDYKQHYLGSFKTALEAAMAYDKKALELFGEFANLNFGSRG